MVGVYTSKVWLASLGDGGGGVDPIRMIHTPYLLAPYARPRT